MARVTFNNSITAIRGKIDGLIFRQMKDGSVIVSRAPDLSNRKFSEEQAKHQQRFQEAATYARKSAHMHPVYTELAEATKKTPYNIALSDWFHPPVIHRILMRGSNILVEASDNVMVAKVEVQVLGEQGEVLEQGEAVRLQGDWWEYMPSFAGVKIIAAAWDLAGNVTKAEM